jgi:hypothetical protein
MTGVFARPQDMQVMEKDKQVKETLRGDLRLKMIHAVGVTAQAAENMLGGIAGDGQRPPCGQGDPPLLGTREPSQLMLTAFQASKENQQAGPMFRQAHSHFLKVRTVHPGRDPNELVQASRCHGEAGRPEQTRQQTLEALSAEPLPLRHITCRDQVAALLLIGR